MAVYTIQSEKDLTNLKNLAVEKQKFDNNKLKENIREQTFNNNVDDFFKPITIQQEKLLLETKEIPQAIKDVQPLTQNFYTNPEALTSNINEKVIKDLSRMLTSKNTQLKLEHIQHNRFTLNNHQIQILDDKMIFQDGMEITLTPGVIQALTYNDANFNGMNDGDQNGFLHIISIITQTKEEVIKLVNEPNS